MKIRLLPASSFYGPGDIVIRKFPYILGRSSHCDHQLFHPMISRRHCELIQTDQGIRLSDLNSSNGTYVNGQRIRTPVDLSEGDEIHLGCLAFKISLAGTN